MKKKATVVPKQPRAIRTYEAILDAAQSILEEKGIDKVNSNSIVSRAGCSPPVFYRYFEDKYDILFKLAERLMATQNEIVFKYLSESKIESKSFQSLVNQVCVQTISVTRSFKAGSELLVLMRMIPTLQEVRLNSHNNTAQAIADACIRGGFKLPQEEVFIRSRLLIETSYACIEMLFDTGFNQQEKVLERNAVAAWSIMFL